MSERADPRPQGAQQDAARAVLYSTSGGNSNATPSPNQDAAPAKREGKPSHYKVICISMYTEDLKRLDSMVEALKARGLTKANRSALIRYALGEVDLDRVPKGL